MYQIRIIFSLVVLAWGVSGMPVYAQADKENIEKCQDRDGRWHYGTFAARACTKGRISILTEQGVVIDRKESPDVMMELSDQERNAALAVQRKKEALKRRIQEDQAYLSRYSDEAAVVAERNRKLAELDMGIDTAKKVQADLDRDIAILRERTPSEENATAIVEREMSVAAYEQEIVRYQAEQQAIRAEYAKKVSRFKEALSRADEVQEQ